MAKTVTHTDGASGVTTNTTIDANGNVNVTQTTPTNLHQGVNSSTTTTSSHDSTTTVNGVVTHEEHTVSGNAVQPAD